MKITIAQLNYHLGDFEGNTSRMLEAIDEAKQVGSNIVCFGELATCGYPPRDFLEFDDFIRLAQESIDRLAEAARGIAVVVGSPSVNPVPEGKDLYNSLYFLADGEVKYVQHKTLLPTYDIFDEYRYFEPATEWGVVEYKGKKIALTVCEDIWNVGNENPLYTICPMDEIIGFKPDFIINGSASPFDYDHAEDRIEVLKENVNRYGLPMFYINHIGAQTEVIFDGGSIVMSPDGTVYEEMAYFIESIRTFDLEDVVAGGRSVRQKKDKIEEIHHALVLGISDYFRKLGFHTAVLGLSGGIDSAVTAVLAMPTTNDATPPPAPGSSPAVSAPMAESIAAEALLASAGTMIPRSSAPLEGIINPNATQEAAVSQPA